MTRLRHPRLKTLVRFAQRELDDRAARRTADHLAECPRCRAMVAEIRQLGDAVRTIEPPAPPAGMRERMLAEREAGERVLLPSVAPIVAKARPVRSGIAAAAAIVLALGIGWVAIGSLRNEPNSYGGECMRTNNLSNLLFGTGLMLSTACAQDGPAGAAFPPLPDESISAQSLQPGTWVYRVQSILNGDVSTLRATTTLILSRMPAGGETGWFLVSDVGGEPDPENGIWATHLDTAFLSLSDLQPIAHRRYLRTQKHPSRLLLRHAFRDGAITGSIGFRQERHLDIRVVGERPIVLHAEHLMMLLQTLRIDRTWQRSIRVLGFATTSPSHVNLRVVGEGRVSVPAGTFDSWVIELSDGRESLRWWVAKDNGWVIQAEEARDGDWSRRLVLSTWTPGG
jgi:hypothetical protein